MGALLLLEGKDQSPPHPSKADQGLRRPRMAYHNVGLGFDCGFRVYGLGVLGLGL